MGHENIDQKVEILTKNMSAAYLALCNALDRKGVLAREDIQTALQERLTRMLVDQGQPAEDLLILKWLALNLGNAARD